MRPAPSWLPPVMLAWGLAVILPVLVLGVVRGTLLRSLGVASAMAAMWTAFYLFYTRIGMPPLWVSIVLCTVGPWLVLRRAWSTTGPMLGFRGKQAP